MTSFRLVSGGRIDRSRTLRFSFDGREMTGHAGDTLASALLANGQMLMGRSFKYHRPRGVVTAGSSEPNALVTTGKSGRTQPNTRATMLDLHDGLVARSQNSWPSLTWDIGALNGLLSPFLGAGFYYKTFMWPGALWEKLYEPFIRRAAGLGRATNDADPDHYAKAWAHCDLLVVGAGPAGLSAALTAARTGARVILADEQSETGGSLLAETQTVDGQSPADFIADALRELAGFANVRIMQSTTVFGWYDDNVFGAVEQPDAADRTVERIWRIAARRAVIATGAEERPLVFGGNDRPGVMTADAMRTYLNRFGVAPGRSPVIFTVTDAAYRLAADLEAVGIVPVIVDARTDARPAYTGKARIIAGGEVIATRGRRALSSVTVRIGGRTETIAADALAMSGGFSPVIHLACHRGGRPVWDETRAAFLAPEGLLGLALAGAAVGVEDIASCIADGAAAAQSMLAEIGLAPAPAARPTPDVRSPVRPLWSVRESKGKAFVDFQNDVHVKDLQSAVTEGYGHVELAKRYTTNGMATDQGKLSNVNAIGVLAEKRGLSPAEIGTTTFRPFYTPVTFGALAGAHTGMHFQPVRKSPLHDWAERHGARFVETGLWYRSAWFQRPEETSWRESVDREAKNARVNAGICDVSMLGKIEIFGDDAAEFLNRVYCNAFLKLPVGKARYGLMLREDGMIYDDGTTSRLGPNHYFMTTTTAFAAGVMNHLEFCAQALWPELDVRLASVTDQWAQMAVAGPKSRAILQQIVDDDISAAAFPFLSAREVSLLGGKLTGRLFSISFSGELAYELAVPADHGDAVAELLMQVGKAHGLQPYGSETLGVLRVEKGFVTHSEINGTVTPGDLGLGKMAQASKPDFIGKAMLAREGLNDPDRLQLVGVRPLDPNTSFRAGSHILRQDDHPTLANDQGYVTSAIFSPHIGSTIGLALVKRGPTRHGEHVVVWNDLCSEYTPATLCDPVFVDPSNEKRND
ncbi:MAG: sarcosine oxidase subunit alpha family protein [Rhizobiaceae bacterium]